MVAPTHFQQALEYQADQIEMVLASHRVPARVTGGMVTPRWIRYQTVPELTTKVSRINALAEEIALRLGAPSVRIARQGATVQIDVPRTDAQTVRLLNLCKKLKMCLANPRCWVWMIRAAAAAPAFVAGGGARPGGRHHRLRQNGAGSQHGPFVGYVQPAG